MQSPSSRRVLGALAAGWLRAGVERARGRAGDEASELSRAGGCRALQARTRTLFFTLSKMGKPGGPSRAENKNPLPLATIPRTDCRGRDTSRRGS